MRREYLLELDHSSPESRERGRCLLARSPWGWPDPGDEPEAYERAREMVPVGPVPLKAGQVMLLTADLSGRTACAWDFLPGDRSELPRETTALFGARAIEAWEMARATLPRALPLLWTGLDQWPLPRQAARLASSADMQIHPPAQLDGLDGPSFGLPFALSLASQALSQPLADDFAATGELDATGNVRPVGGVGSKVLAALQVGHRLRRLLVPLDNLEEACQARDAAGITEEQMAIRPVKSLAEAVQLLFGEDVPRCFVESGSTPELRQQRVLQLYRLALGPRDAAVVWLPVAKAAELALTAWARDLDAIQQERLEFARVVACRHDGIPTTAIVPSKQLMADLARHRPLLIEHVAHVVQQAADQDSPSVVEAEPLAVQFLVREGALRCEVDLKLLGAYGRLLEVTGRPQEGLECCREATRGWLDGVVHASEASWPLSKWLWLAGSCGDRRALEEAERACRELAALCPSAQIPWFYMDLARYRARTLMGMLEPEHYAGLRRLACRLSEDGSPAPKIPDHVCLPAARWLRRAARQAGRHEDLAAADALLSDSLPGSEMRSSFRFLADLDDAYPDLAAALVPKGTETADKAAAGRARDALDGLARIRPGRIRLLVRAAKAADVEPALYVARFYPY